MKTIITTGQLVKFLEMLGQQEVTPDSFQRRLASGVLADVFHSQATFANRDGWREAFGLGKFFSDDMTLAIDYSKSLPEMIYAAGKFHWVCDEIIPEFYPIVGEGLVVYEFNILKFDKGLYAESAVEAIRRTNTMHAITNPWEPAKIEHLLEFARKFKDKKMAYMVAAFGSCYEEYGSRGFPFLEENGMEHRSLGLYHWEDFINDDRGVRALVVREVINPVDS